MAQLKTSLILDLVDRMSRPAARARGQLKKIQETAGKIEGFRKLSKQTADTSKKMRQAQTRVKELAVKMKKAEKPSKRLQASFKSAKKEASQYKTTLSKQSEKLELLRRDLHGAGVKTRDLGKHQRALASKTERLTRKINRLNKVSRAMNSARGFGGNVFRAGKRAAKGVGIAIAAVTGMSVLFNRVFIGTAASFERYKTILETLEGSSDKAKKSMDWVSDFAAKTPFELDEVMAAFVKLRTFGLEPTDGLLKTLGDTSAAMGLPIIQGVEAIADAVTGENERLKEFGIKARVEGKKTVFEYTKNGQTMRRIADNTNRAMIQSVLQSIWNDKFKGAMAKQSKTWKGMISNLGDQWTRFVNMVMEAGAFDVIKGKLESILKTINKMAASGKLKKIAEELSSNVVKAVESISKIGKAALNVFDDIDAKLKVITVPLGWLAGLGKWLGKDVNQTISATDQVFGTGVRKTIDESVFAKTIRESVLGTPIELTDGAKAALANQSRLGLPIRPAESVTEIINNAVSHITGSIHIKIDSEGRPKIKQLKSNTPGFDLTADTGAVMVTQ